MSFQEINSFIAPIGLIIAGVLMNLSKNNEMFGKFKKFSLFFVIGGMILLLTRILR
ncbi:MAG: hypothetical protein RLZZ323_1215 [Bacteroidota bacterium]|jgi:flagellar biogenesis protein FliO